MKLYPHQQHVSSDLDKIIKKMSKNLSTDGQYT